MAAIAGVAGGVGALTQLGGSAYSFAHAEDETNDRIRMAVASEILERNALRQETVDIGREVQSILGDVRGGAGGRGVSSATGSVIDIAASVMSAGKQEVSRAAQESGLRIFEFGQEADSAARTGQQQKVAAGLALGGSAARTVGKLAGGLDEMRGRFSPMTSAKWSRFKKDYWSHREAKKPSYVGDL